MIPYEELAAALQRWRLRNGLPVADLAVASSPAPITTSAVPVATPASPTTRSTRHAVPAAPAGWTAPARAPAAAPAPAGRDLDVELGDVDVIDEDLYAADGGDFAVSFDGRKGQYDDEAAGESTAIGHPSGAQPQYYDEGQAPAFRPGTFDDVSLEDDGQIIEEADEEPPPRRR